MFPLNLPRGWLSAAALLLFATAAGADGGLFPVAESPVPLFRIRYHRVTVTIEGPVAVTEIDQVFVNETKQRRAAQYLFPVPLRASLNRFAVEVDGEPKQAQLRPRAQARAIYEEIVRRQRDPGLLRYVEQDLYQVDVFPMPPRGERRVLVRYTELLPREGNTYHYHYLLSTQRFSSKPLEEVSLRVRLKNPTPLTNIYSPTHEVTVKRLSPRAAEVVYAAENVLPQEDFDLYYSVAPTPVGLSVLAHRLPGEDGYFLLLAAPSLLETTRPVPKDVVFVFDRSGSMSGQKIEQAKAALHFCLARLNSSDRFNILAFNHEIQAFAESLQPVEAARLRAAQGFVNRLRAAGSTNIEAALRQGLGYPLQGERPRYLIFLTDGLPTAGDTNIESLLRKVKRWNEAARMFVFGAGYDVNTHFLDRLAEQNRGVSTYIRPEESIEAKVAAFYQKIAAPILTELALDFSGVKVYALYPGPEELPDLFSGSQLLVLGRYRRGGRVTITLRGRAGGKERKFRLRTHLPKVEEAHDFLPRLWAARRIAALTDEARLRGRTAAVAEEITRLSKRFGVLTEHTAFLVRENQYQSVAALSRQTAANMERARRVKVGLDAVNQAANVALRRTQAQTNVNVIINARGERETIAEMQAVGRRAFVQQGRNWVDTGVEPNYPVVEIQAFSPAYFQLSRAIPEANQYLALGPQVEFQWQGQIVRVGEKGLTHLTEAQLAQLQRGRRSAVSTGNAGEVKG